MASRSSGLYSTEFYQGSVRGRDISNGIGWEMFPEKLERTEIFEDPNSLRQDQRNTLRDEGPETSSLFPWETPRRNGNWSRGILNLKIYGAVTPTDPYIGMSDDVVFDTQFHDKDPRGYLSEVPWNEYRRQQEANMRRIDFKDDGDYSIPSSGISPYTMYQNIRSAQNWTKARMKIFSEEFENRNNGGVGTYAHTSKVYKVHSEDTTMIDDGTLSATIEDPVIRQRTTMKLSNLVHGGSKELRTDSTTDHDVKVSAYGKLYSQRGLIPHESQLRILEDDTPWSQNEGRKASPRNLVAMMSSALQDGPQLDPKTAAQSARLMYQDAALQGSGQEKFQGARDLQQSNRSLNLTRDIMSLLGFVEQDVKFLESQGGANRKKAQHAIANLHDMAEIIHALPANAKLEMRNELILRSNGGGLRPGSDVRRVQDQVVVNPKIVQYMDMRVNRSAPHGDMRQNDAEIDPEGRLNKGRQDSVYIFRNMSRLSEQVDVNRRQGELGTSKYGGRRGEDNVASYKSLARAANPGRDKYMGEDVQFHEDATATSVYKTPSISVTDVAALNAQAEQDIERIDHRLITRRTGTKTNKSAVRRNIVNDNGSLDFMTDAVNGSGRKTPKTNRATRYNL